MADAIVEPSTLELTSTLQTVTLPGVTHLEMPDNFELTLSLSTPLPIISFPTLSRKPSHRFENEPIGDGVLIGSTASGYPVLNKVITFDPPVFAYDVVVAAEADKLAVMTFYDQNKDKSFPWHNDQDSNDYTVCFGSKPKCRIDGLYNLWRISLVLIQVES